eukprot:GHVR01159869.1.p1 GENE.GHVR01159869.1~~GHVR01159869.1.p1  ORF type:complete len:105 (+),score=1.52 GHVR01159869.1:70-384(+)
MYVYNMYVCNVSAILQRTRGALPSSVPRQIWLPWTLPSETDHTRMSASAQLWLPLYSDSCMNTCACRLTSKYYTWKIFLKVETRKNYLLQLLLQLLISKYYSII